MKNIRPKIINFARKKIWKGSKFTSSFNNLYILFSGKRRRGLLGPPLYVIVGCHDCNCSMHLPTFSAVDARSTKKGHYCILWHNHRQHRSAKTKKGQHWLIPRNFERCVCRSPISITNVSRPLKKYLHTLLILFLNCYGQS